MTEARHTRLLAFDHPMIERVRIASMKRDRRLPYPPPAEAAIVVPASLREQTKAAVERCKNPPSTHNAYAARP